MAWTTKARIQGDKIPSCGMDCAYASQCGSMRSSAGFWIVSVLLAGACRHYRGTNTGVQLLV